MSAETLPFRPSEHCRREFPRLALAAMYSAVEITIDTEDGPQVLDGHAYDVSAGGVRIELDEPVAAGTPVHVRLDLPGVNNSIRVRGDIVRLNDDPEDPLALRMGVAFRFFESLRDACDLRRFLGMAQPESGLGDYAKAA